MGLFGLKKKEGSKKLSPKELAEIDVKYIYDLTQVIGDSSNTIIEIHETCEDIDAKYPTEAMEIFAESTEITKKAIEELKTFNSTTSPQLIEKYKSKVKELQEKSGNLLKEMAGQNE